MVNDLLDLAKVEAGRVEISPAWFEMVDLFSALRGMFRPVLTNPDVTLVFEEPQHVLAAVHRRQEAVADPAQLHLQRAQVHASRARCACRHGRTPDGTITFAVADTGIGIDPKFHSAIFHRLHAGGLADPEAPARHRPGAVAEQAAGRTAGRHGRIAERTGRRLHVLRDDSVAHEPPDEPRADQPSGRMTDDQARIPADRPIGARAADHRRQPGEPLRHGAPAAQRRAFARARRPTAPRAWRPRTIPSPRSSSTSTCPTSTASTCARMLRSRPATARLPVLHLTAAYVTDEDKVRGLDSGADAYLTRPVEPPCWSPPCRRWCARAWPRRRCGAASPSSAPSTPRRQAGIALLDDQGALRRCQPRHADACWPRRGRGRDRPAAERVRAARVGAPDRRLRGGRRRRR